MIFLATEIEGVFIVEPERLANERGFFARVWCREDFAAHGVDEPLDQCSISFNRRAGTLRGLHYQAPPHTESKLVRCTAGLMFDVAADIRPGSPTFGHWIGIELSQENRRALFVPWGFAHGFQTLADDTEVLYQMSGRYEPEAQRGILWDDATLAVAWPLADPILSPRDRLLPPLAAPAAEIRARSPATVEA